MIHHPSASLPYSCPSAVEQSWGEHLESADQRSKQPGRPYLSRSSRRRRSSKYVETAFESVKAQRKLWLSPSHCLSRFCLQVNDRPLPSNEAQVTLVRLEETEFARLVASGFRQAGQADRQDITDSTRLRHSDGSDVGHGLKAPYRALCPGRAVRLQVRRESQRNNWIAKEWRVLVDDMGLEPTTSALRTRRSPD